MHIQYSNTGFTPAGEPTVPPGYIAAGLTEVNAEKFYAKLFAPGTGHSFAKMGQAASGECASLHTAWLS